MTELATAAGSGALLKTREIADRQDIPLKYLEQIINTLKKHQLVTSVRGAEGGYRLSRDARQITVLEILTALEGDLSLINRDGAPGAPGQRTFWDDLETRIRDMLNIPLSEFAEAGRASERGLMYYI